MPVEVAKGCLGALMLQPHPAVVQPAAAACVYKTQLPAHRPVAPHAAAHAQVSSLLPNARVEDLGKVLAGRQYQVGSRVGWRCAWNAGFRLAGQGWWHAPACDLLL